MNTGGYKVPKNFFTMTREEREQYEKTRKKYDPKSLFQEQNEAYKKSRLSELKPNRMKNERILKQLYSEPDTPDLWDDIGKDGNK